MPVHLLLEATPLEHSVLVTYVYIYWLKQLLNTILFSYPILYMLHFHDIMIKEPTGLNAPLSPLCIPILLRKTEGKNRIFNLH